MDVCQCLPTQSDFLTCPDIHDLLASSVFWYVVWSGFLFTIADDMVGCRGLIGPNCQFGTGLIYHLQLYAIIMGTFRPLLFWLWQWHYPQSWVCWVSTPLTLLNCMNFIPPAMGINYSSWFLIGFIFQYLIWKCNFTWWIKFSYLMSVVMDSGTTYNFNAFYIFHIAVS